MSKAILFFENPVSKDTGSAILRKTDNGHELIVGDTQTQNFAIMRETKSIMEMAVKSNTPIRVLANGPISTQEQCNVKLGDIPLGTIGNDYPLMLNQSLVLFEVETARSGGYGSTYKLEKYLGEIVAIDAR